VFSSDDRPDVTSDPYAFELLWNTLHIWSITEPEAFLLCSELITESMKHGGITVQLKITSQATNFISLHVVEDLL
jgi:hypothetical protein